MDALRSSFNMPPGCFVRDIPGNGDYEAPVYKCARCGRFLKHKADRFEHWEAKVQCPGWGSDPDLEFRMNFALCGSGKPHDAHEFVEDCGQTAIRICSNCGLENKEV